MLFRYCVCLVTKRNKNKENFLSKKMKKRLPRPRKASSRASKLLVIVTITVVAVLTLSLLFMFSDTLVGKAYKFIKIPVCGNNKCETGEAFANCAQDCAPVCGDKICEKGEDFKCPMDCIAKLEVYKKEEPWKNYTVTSCSKTDNAYLKTKGTLVVTLENQFGSKMKMELEDTCVSDVKVMEYFCDENSNTGFDQEVFDCQQLFGSTSRCIEHYNQPFVFLGSCKSFD